jgi:hypothetical protein
MPEAADQLDTAIANLPPWCLTLIILACIGAVCFWLWLMFRD